jgi:C-terminal processing protease CtpA/Prc
MKNRLITFLIGSSLVGTALCESTNETAFSQTTEIVDILKASYVDHDRLNDDALEAATLTGLLQSLGRGVKIFTSEPVETNLVAAAATTNSPLARAEVIAPDIGYIRLSDVQPASVRALDDELQKFAEAKVTGYILDLRFADGTNCEAVAKVASRFLAGDKELFSLKRATGESPTFHTLPLVQEPAEGLSTVPLLLLVNEHTSGSAEALAGALRAHERGIIIGHATAGRPVATANIKLNDGRWLQVATAKIVLTNGSSPFPDGLAPDVPVKIARAVERSVVLATTNITLTASLQPKQKKKVFSEAELVKAFRGEAFSTAPMSLTDDETESVTPAAATSNGVSAATAPAPEADDLRDTVLERAVDIMKGIRVLAVAP